MRKQHTFQTIMYIVDHPGENRITQIFLRSDIY